MGRKSFTIVTEYHFCALKQRTIRIQSAIYQSLTLRLMKKLLFPILAVLILSGCSNDLSIPVTDETDATDIKKEEVRLNKMEKAIGRYITSTRAKTRGEDFNLVPYVVDDDTLMYIANYGEGWEVFSNNARFPMVIMRSQTGTFDIESIKTVTPFYDVFESTVNDLIALEHTSESLPISDSWIPFYDGINNLNERGAISRSGGSDLEDPGEGYTWKPYTGETIEMTTAYTPLGGRLRTHWGQGRPYNQFTKYCVARPDSVHMCPVGCTPVAIGQYLFWAHNNLGVPQTTVDSQTYDPDKNVFSFSGNSTEPWDNMESDDNPISLWNNSLMAPTAIFLGSLGVEMGTSYGCKASGTYNSKIKPTLAKYLNTDISSQNGSTSAIRDILARHYPVCCSSSNDKGTRHTYLIDYCKSKYTHYTTYYVKMQSIGDDIIEEEPDELGPTVTYEELSEFYDDIRVETYSIQDYYVKMNWGWNGLYDDIEYNLKVFSWSTGNTTYYKPTIYYPASVLSN